MIAGNLPPMRLLFLLAFVLLGGCAANKPVEAKASTPTEEVTFTGAGGVKLVGTLLMPKEGKPVAAMLLLPGSGPTDRNGNSGIGITTNLLKQIAEALQAKGVATLRFDKRATAGYRNIWPQTAPEVNKFFSYKNFVDDAKAAYTFLSTQKGIDPTKVGIIGHSEGALFTLQMCADMAAEHKPYKAILLASTGRPMTEVLHDQISYRLAQGKAPAAETKKYLDYTDAATKALAAGKPLPPNEPAGLGPLFNATVLDLMGAYCRIDPAELASKSIAPTLVVQGKDDAQISYEMDTPRLLQALHKRSGVETQEMIEEGLTHNLKQSLPNYKDVFDGPVPPKVLDKICDFVTK